MAQILLVLHVLIAAAMIALVLLQHGKGADMGAGFGSGASGTVFGASGSGNFLTKMTSGLALAFFVNCLVLAYLAAHSGDKASVMDAVDVPALEAAQQEAEIDAAVNALESAADQQNAVAPSSDDIPVVPELGMPADSDIPELPADIPAIPE